MSKFNSFTTLIVTTFASVALVTILYWVAKPDHEIKNGFNRRLEKFPLSLEKIIPLGRSNYDFAGWSDSKLYLSDVKQPYALIELSGINISDTVKLTNDLSDRVVHGQVIVDSSYFFMADLDHYHVYRGSVTNWSTDKTMSGPNFFSEYLPVNDSTIAYRAFSNDRKEYRLIVQRDIDTLDGTGLIQKQIDGLFCTDGVLQFDKPSQTLVYTYYYRNEFLKATTGLQLLGRSRTIDTTTVAKISVAKNEKEKYSSLSSPPQLVNLGVECYSNQLYVRSNLMGDNEERNVFRSSDVIDIYDLRTGSYRYSFYVAHKNDIKMTHFNVKQERLYIIRRNQLEIYSFPDQLNLANHE